MNTLRNLLQESGGDLLVRGELLEVDRNEKLLSLLVNITNIDTTLVGEEDPVTLSGTVSNRLQHDWRKRAVAASQMSRNTSAQQN